MIIRGRSCGGSGGRRGSTGGRGSCCWINAVVVSRDYRIIRR